MTISIALETENRTSKPRPVKVTAAQAERLVRLLSTKRRYNEKNK